MPDSTFTREENLTFWKDLILVGIFFVVTPLTIGVTLFSLFSIKSNNIKQEKIAVNFVNPSSGAKVFASLPSEFPTVYGTVGQADARVEIVKQYMEYYKSPLALFAGDIVKAADAYSLDFRLITAIAQQESNLCKIIPPGSFNCWGWGIHAKGTLGFTSFTEGINEVSKGLKEEYLDKGYATVSEIMTKYTPLSNGSWAEGVNHFMTEMQ
jgi:hypothetical protein